MWCLNNAANSQNIGLLNALKLRMTSDQIFDNYKLHDVFFFKGIVRADHNILDF